MQGEAGRERGVCRAALGLPHRQSELRPGARSSASPLAAVAQPQPAGARGSPCRSRSATGFKVGAGGPTAAPLPGVPTAATCARRALGGLAARGKRTRRERVRAPRFPALLFVSCRREGVRFAQSPAGEETG